MITICKLVDKGTRNADTTVRLDEISNNVNSIYREVQHIRDTLPGPGAEDGATNSIAEHTSGGSKAEEKEEDNTAADRSRTIMENLQEYARCASVIIATASTISDVRGA